MRIAAVSAALAVSVLAGCAPEDRECESMEPVAAVVPRPGPRPAPVKPKPVQRGPVVVVIHESCDD